MKFSSVSPLLVLMHCLLATNAVFAEINRDLELDALFTTINHTQTQHGCDALRSLLAQPITNQQTLEDRQAVIAYIAHNTKLHTQLNGALKAFATYEPQFARIMQPASDIEVAALEDFYFSSEYCKEWNYNPARLELGYAGHCANLCSSMAQHALFFAIFTGLLGEEHVCASHPAKNTNHSDKKQSHKKKIMGITTTTINMQMENRATIPLTLHQQLLPPSFNQQILDTHSTCGMALLRYKSSTAFKQ